MVLLVVFGQSVKRKQDVVPLVCNWIGVSEYGFDRPNNGGGVYRETFRRRFPGGCSQGSTYCMPAENG